jgi:nitroreductase
MEEIISEFNRYWAVAAPVIGLIASRPSLEGFMARTAEFDTGAAAMSLQLQATKLGLRVHLLGGIDLDVAYAKTGFDPDEVNILAAFALGHEGDGSNLSEKHQGREHPSPRMPVSGFVFKGLTPGPRPDAEG